jgi:hypothetical protein
MGPENAPQIPTSPVPLHQVLYVTLLDNKGKVYQSKTRRVISPGIYGGPPADPQAGVGPWPMIDCTDVGRGNHWPSCRDVARHHGPGWRRIIPTRAPLDRGNSRQLPPAGTTLWAGI